MHRATILFISIAVAAATLQIYKDTNPLPLHYINYRVKEGDIKIDGRLDEVAWQEVPWTSDFVDIQGSDRIITIILRSDVSQDRVSPHRGIRLMLR